MTLFDLPADLIDFCSSVPQAQGLDLRGLNATDALVHVVTASIADRHIARLAYLGALVEAAGAIRPGHVVEIPSTLISAARWDADAFEREVEAAGHARLYWMDQITAQDPGRLVYVALPPLTPEEQARAIGVASAAAGE